jgi:hypothetical protein
LVPGQKLCGNCRKHLFGGDDFSDSALLPETSLKEDDTQLHEADLDSSMMHIGVLPVKLKSLSGRSKLKYAKRKVDEVKTQVKTKVAHVLKLPEEELESDSSNASEESVSNLQRKAKDLDYLVDKMKEKLSVCTNTREKLQIFDNSPSILVQTENCY